MLVIRDCPEFFWMSKVTTNSRKSIMAWMREIDTLVDACYTMHGSYLLGP